MKSYGQYCPIARAAEIFAERWTPIIIRNVHLGAVTFTEIRAGAPGIPRSVLSSRLDHLTRAGILERTGKPSGRGWSYTLTDMGEELFDVSYRLGVWGARWLEMTPEAYDPYIVLWAIAQGIPWGDVPPRRVVISFDFVDRPARHRYFWLKLEHPNAEVCVSDPGFDCDLTISAEARAFVDWHIGRLSWQDAVDDGRIRMVGLGPIANAFPGWNPKSHFVHVTPAVASTR